jgi:hypothetical protein
MMEAASASETSVNFYQTARRYNPEDSHLYPRRRENLKSQLQYCLFLSVKEKHDGHENDVCVIDLRTTHLQARR